MGSCCCAPEESFTQNERTSIPEETRLLPYGEPLSYDRSFKGPQWKRSCTDVPCLFIFILFLGAWGFIANYAFRNGDLDKLIAPTDSFNKKCGIDSQVLDKKYLFFFNLEKCIDPLVPITGCPTPQVCVAKCPSQTFIWDTMKDTLNMQELKDRLICQTDEDKNRIFTKQDAEFAINNNRCARWYVKSAPLSWRCVPSDAAGINKLINDIHLSPAISSIADKMLGADFEVIGEKVVEDIISSWHVIFLALVFAMAVSLIFIALMRWIACPILWFSILGVLVGLSLGIYYSIQQYTFYRNNPSVPNHSLNLNSAVKNIFQKHDTWLYLSILLSIALIVIFLLVIVLRKRIMIAIALIREGSKAVSCVISTVFFPIFSWVLFIGAIAWGVSVGLYLASIGEPSFKMIKPLDASGAVPNEVCTCEGAAANYVLGSKCDPAIFQKNCFVLNADSNPIGNLFRQRSMCSRTGCFFDKIQSPPLVSYFLAYNIVGFFWLTFFIAAFADMVLAATFATWYWTFHKSEVPYFILSRAFGRTIRYHLGTLAFGSLILTICRIIRIILEYIHAKLKKYDNSVTRAILCCMRCFFWCLESFLRFLNRNAYIMCAIHGNNFCESAKDSFNLLMRNFLRVITLDKVTDFLFFLSKILLTGVVGVATYCYVANSSSGYQLHYNAVPTGIVVIATFLITSVFFGVYSMAVDTLFLCFLEDCERNDGSAERPYFMSKQLMKILGKRNQMPNQISSS